MLRAPIAMKVVAFFVVAVFVFAMSIVIGFGRGSDWLRIGTLLPAAAESEDGQGDRRQ